MNDDLIPDYIAEAEDRGESIYKSIGHIDQSGLDEKTLNELLRDVHSLKAAANATGLTNSAKLLHKLEDFLELVKDEKISIDDTCLEMLYECIDEVLSIAKELKPEQADDGDSFILIDKLDLYISVATGGEMEAEKEVKKRTSPQKSKPAKPAAAPEPVAAKEPEPVIEAAPEPIPEPTPVVPVVTAAPVVPEPVPVPVPATTPTAPIGPVPPEIQAKLNEVREEIEYFDPESFSDKELLTDITDDVTNILEEMANHVIELEKNPDSKDLIDRVFREIHTIKGDSGMVPIPQISKLSHYMENVLDEVRDGIYAINSVTMDIILEGVDLLERMLENMKNNELLEVDITSVLEKLVYISAINKNQLDASHLNDKSIFGDQYQGQEIKQTATPEVPVEVSTPAPISDNKALADEIMKQKMQEIQPAIPEPAPVAAQPTPPQPLPEPVKAATPVPKPAVKTTTDKPAPQKSIKKSIQTLRVDIGKLDAGMNLVSELVTNKIRFDERLRHLVTVLNNLDKSFKNLAENKFNMHNAKLIGDLERKLMSRLQESNMLSREISEDFTQSINEFRGKTQKIQKNIFQTVKNLTEDLKINIYDAEETSETLINTMDSLGNITSGLQENLMKIRMLPVSTVFNKFPRMVREIAKERGKEVNLIIQGEETELDKNVIEEIGDPILHILRNSIDHGLETVKEREAVGKNPVGTLVMNAYYEGNQVVIEVIDDGKGIDPEKVRAKAIEKGVITPEQAATMSDIELRDLVFRPGFSTAGEITDISGRGVGMDVVKSNITKLKGVIDLDSKTGAGTTVKIRLPLTLAVLHSLLVKCQKETFAIPLSFVDKTIVLSSEQIKRAGNSTVINYLGNTVPIFRLADILQLGNEMVYNNNKLPIIVVKIGKDQYALQVDELLGRLEVVIKNLGDLLKTVKHVTGATIMGDGSVILILDIPAIISSAYTKSSSYSFNANSYNQPIAIDESTTSEPEEAEAVDTADKRYVLVVEDSNTVRKSIVKSLQSAGFNILEAVDGQQGLEMAKKHPIRLFTVDIMMPIMDGYTLTKKLRELDQYKKTPILIISSKDKKVDKVKGLEAGADEYLTKPFEKNQLVDAVRKRMNA